MNPHMLPYPFRDMAVTPDDLRAMLADVEGRAALGGATLHTTMTHLVFLVLIGMAKRARGKRAAATEAFTVGAGLVGYDWATKALDDIERDFLIPLLNLEGEDEAIFDEIAAFGRRALDHGELGNDGVLRV